MRHGAPVAKGQCKTRSAAQELDGGVPEVYQLDRIVIPHQSYNTEC